MESLRMTFSRRSLTLSSKERILTLSTEESTVTGKMLTSPTYLVPVLIQLGNGRFWHCVLNEGSAHPSKALALLVNVVLASVFQQDHLQLGLDDVLRNLSCTIPTRPCDDDVFYPLQEIVTTP